MKRVFLGFLLCAIFSFSLFAQAEVPLTPEQKKELRKAEIDSKMTSVMLEINDVVAEGNASLNTYGDSFIGKMWPAIPAHWGAGISISSVFFDISKINSLTESLTSGIKELSSEAAMEFGFPQVTPFPTGAVSLRLGGIGLPVDIGLHAMNTFGLIQNIGVSKNESQGKFGIDLTTLGADLRICVLNIEYAPKISIGGGYSYSLTNFTESKTCSLSDKTVDGKTGTLISSCSAELKNTTHSWFGQVQLSKRFGAFVPFGGYKALMNYYTGEYKWSYGVKLNYEEAEEIKTIDKGENSGSSNIAKQGFTFYNQVFLGVGIQAKNFMLNLCGLYNINTNYISATLNIGMKF